MKKLRLLFLVLTILTVCTFTTNTNAQCGNLYIAGVIDGPLMGGTPKGLQLCASGAIADLSIYGVESVTNGAGSSGTEEFTFSAEALNAGDCVWITTDLAQFGAYFGFNACYVNSVIGVNGNDALVLYCSGSVADVFGDTNTDGLGEAWEYTDSWAVSNDMVANATFDVAEWTYGGPNALDGETSNSTATTPYPNAVANCPTMVEIEGCTEMAACNFDPTATADDGSCYSVGDSCDDGNAVTTGDIYVDCATCAGTCPGGGAPGDTCDDDDANTVNDLIQSDCSCAGTPLPSGECANLYIAGVLDGPLPNGTPKSVQLCASGAITDLSEFGIESVTNGGGSSGSEEFTLPAGTLDAGDCVWITNNAEQFNAYFGFDACYETSVTGINGDDAVVLYCANGVIDVFGDTDTDGTGEAWEYTDSWAVSNDMVGNPVFDDTQWTFAGPGALDGETSNDTAANPYPNAGANCPPMVIQGCTDMNSCNYNPAANIDNGTCYSVGDPCDDGNPTTSDDIYTDCNTCEGTGGLNDCGTFAWEAVQTVNNSQVDVWTAVTGGWSIDGDLNGGNPEQIDQWLIYGPLDVSATTALSLNFDADETSGTTNLNVAWTNNYTGCPADATWTTVATVTADGSVAADLSAATGTNVYIGIEYSDNGLDGYSEWELTNFLLAADVCPSPGLPMISMCTMTFDCPDEMLNFGVSCDDGNDFTVNDIIQNDCICAGTPLVSSDIYISELSFNPCAEQGDDGDCEYLIITNSTDADVDISNYTLDNGISFMFPDGTILPAGGSLSIGTSADCTGLDAFDIVEFSGSFSNSNDETIEILDTQCSTISTVTYDGSIGDGDCNANCFDSFGIPFECPSSIYNPMFDCPNDEVNFGDDCDDGDATTVNDVIQSDCTCAGIVPTPADIYITELSFNPCTDQGSDGDCEYVIITNVGMTDADISDYMLANGITYTFPAGTILPTGGTISIGTSPDCMGLDAFDLVSFSGGLTNGSAETVEILDASGALVSAVTYNTNFGDGNCEANCFDAVGTASECPSSLYNPMFDCVDEMVDFGDSCDDNNPNTTNDMIQIDCSCAGTIPTFDCPDEMANIGDDCDDGDSSTTGDIVQSDCACVGTPIADIYISELSFNPCDAQGDDCDCEYLIITNAGDTDADISDYEIDNGNTFTFPAGTIIPAGGTLSVGATANCEGLNAFDLTGLEGSFNDLIGETIELVEPLDGSIIGFVNYNTAFGNGNCNANCFDQAGVASECPSSLYDGPAGCTLTAGSCAACPAGDDNIAIDLTTGEAFNEGTELCADFGCGNPIDPPPNYDPTTNTGTWTLPAGVVNAFAVGGVNGLSLPNVISGGCLTADLNVISGDVPFVVEFRIENGTGAPGNNGEALVFDVTVDGSGMCSMGGDFSTGTAVNGFTFTPATTYSVVVAIADFSGGPAPSEIVIEVSNIALSVCAPNVMGCTNPNACNFDPMATVDDNSCLVPTGCDECDDMGGLIDNPEPGDSCDDMDAATINDTVQADCSCAGVLPDEGCTDPNATNFDDTAMVDNGTCLYLCDDDPADLLPISTNTPFNSSENAYALQSGMGLLEGANDDFAGFIWNVNTAGLTNDDYCISIDYTVTGDAVAFPITLEFRIENIDCGSDSCPSTNFNIEVTGPGTYTLGGIVSTGTDVNGGFDPAGANTSVVAAIANFSGTPLAADIIIEFDNLCVSVDCAPPPADCAPNIIQFPANPSGN